MNSELSFQDFLTNQSVHVDLASFAINIALAAVLATILSWVYARFGDSLSNRSSFGRNFVLVATTTVLIISVVKSSLALSLGLVGALSIVRFRAAIKEPEELAYLFLNIAIGLGLGADQRVVTVVAFVVIVSLIALLRFGRRGAPSHNLYMTVDSTSPEKLSLDRIVDVMRAGAEGYIRKPFTAETLNQKITEVRKKRELSAQAATAASLAGRLEEIGFPELIQFLTGCRRNGRVVIEAGGKAGTIDLREGEARAAEWGNLTGDEAVYAIAECDSGTFRFQPAQGNVEKNVTLPTMSLLIEALRKRDEKASAV